MLRPNHFLALNNLAYALAIRKNDAAAALPLAKRAYAISVSDPAIGDTLAWVYHLLGDDAAAAPIVVSSARRAPANSEIRLHAAFILAGTDPKGATEHLDGGHPCRRRTRRARRRSRLAEAARGAGPVIGCSRCVLPTVLLVACAACSGTAQVPSAEW